MHPHRTVQTNVGFLVNVLRNYPYLSRAELNTMLPVTAATLTHQIRDLIDAGWVQENSLRRPSTGGRPRVGLTLRNDAAYAISVLIGPNTTTIAVTDFGGHIVVKEHLCHPMASITKGISAINQTIEKLLSTHAIDRQRLAGVGIAIPGIWDPETETVVFSPNLQEWAGMKLYELFRRTTQFSSIVVENDADAAAWGELWFGAGREVQDMMYVLCDVGIGAGIIMQRQLVRGQNNSLGEIGHLFVDSQNSDFVCGCGHFGCLEALASLTALDRYLAQGVPAPVALDTIAQYLAIGLGGLINVLCPQMVVLGGTMLKSYPELWPLTFRYTRSRLLTHLTHKTQLILSPLEDNAALLGLAGLIFERRLAESQGQTVNTVPPSQWLTYNHPPKTPEGST